MRVGAINLKETSLFAFQHAQAGDVAFSRKLLNCFSCCKDISSAFQLGNCIPISSFQDGFSSFHSRTHVTTVFCGQREAFSDLVHKLFHLVHSKVKTLSINDEETSLGRTVLSAQVFLKERSGPSPRRFAGNFRGACRVPQFEKLLLNTDLCFIGECGQIPITELPGLYNQHLSDFL